MEYLRRHTKYENYRKSSRAVRWFWKIFREMSQQERSLFNACGVDAAERQRSLEATFPHISLSGHYHATRRTCFFKIDLPPYPTIEEMREKIHIAMESAALFYYVGTSSDKLKASFIGYAIELEKRNNKTCNILL